MPLRAALRAALILTSDLVKLLTQLWVGYYVMLLCVLVVVPWRAFHATMSHRAPSEMLYYEKVDVRNRKHTVLGQLFGGKMSPERPQNLFLVNPGTEENQGNAMSRKSGFPQQENTDLGVIFGALRDQKGAKRQSKSVD